MGSFAALETCSSRADAAAVPTERVLFLQSTHQISDLLFGLLRRKRRRSRILIQLDVGLLKCAAGIVHLNIHVHFDDRS